MHRPREGDEVEGLLDDLAYLWDAQGPSGKNRGRRALEELLWRWAFLPYDWWGKQETQRTELLHHQPTELGVASIAIEAERRGYDHDLLMEKHPAE
jgi:hypothetical protein